MTGRRSVIRPRYALLGKSLLALLTFALSLVVGEVVVRTVVPQADTYADFRLPPDKFKPNLQRAFDAGDNLHGLNGPTQFSTNAAGLRSNHELVLPKPADEFRVITLGGSTTRCTYVDDDETWPALLEQSLRVPNRTVRVFNAGVDGERSFGHLSNLVDRFLHVEPDLVVVLAGINDLTQVLCEPDSGKTGGAGPSGKARITGSVAFKLLLTESHIGRLLINTGKRWSGDRYFTAEGWLLQDAVGEAYVASRRRRQQEPVSEIERIDLDPLLMERHLRLIARIGQAEGFRVALLTQPTLWHEGLTAEEDAALHMDSRCGTRYRPEVLGRELERFNAATLRVAAEEQAIAFDAAAEIAPILENFYDDVHFNAQGSRRLGTALGAFLTNELVEDRPDLSTSEHSTSEHSTSEHSTSDLSASERSVPEVRVLAQDPSG